jgi:hypothetical protein
MLADALLPLLKSRFAGRPVTVGSPPGPIATFPAAHPDVGDLVIHDDGDELTLYVGNFTHVHFNNYDEALAEEERSQRIAEELVAFLEDVFAERVEFFGSHGGGGGCRGRTKERVVVSKLFFGAQTYVWSGPVKVDR